MASSTVSCHPESSFTITRHYYKGTSRTEQSFDVYEPILLPPRSASSLGQPESSRPTIVLVMGSGWLGHQWWIYRGTNWWNASGAETFAKLGYRTISVRHSGGFFQVPSFRFFSSSSSPSDDFPPTWRRQLFAASLAGLIVGVIFPVVFYQQPQVLQLLHLLLPLLPYVRPWGIVTGVTISLWMFLNWQGQGSAQLDDMIQDVMDALVYIHTQELFTTVETFDDDDDDIGVTLGPKTTSTATLPHGSTQRDLPAPAPSSRPLPRSPSLHRTIVLGGYSSGGHVVATLLSTPHYYAKLKQRLDEGQHHHDQKQDSPLPLEEWIQGIFYLSGVLSLDSWLMNVVTLSVFGKWAWDIPSPYTARSSSSNDDAPRRSPRRSLPPPSYPFRHLIVGCHHEVFGIPILDATFCASRYAKYLSESIHPSIPAKCRLVDSNHWNVLNSQALSDALKEDFPWLWNRRDDWNHDNNEFNNKEQAEADTDTLSSSSTSLPPTPKAPAQTSMVSRSSSSSSSSSSPPSRTQSMSSMNSRSFEE